MNYQFALSILLAQLFVFAANGQQLLQQQIHVEAGAQLWNPLSGGLNNPQYSSGDLNNDGIDDLLIFDRDGDVILTFENGGTPNQIDYTLNPKLKVNFPDSIKYWAMLRDFNLDGIVDLFSYSIKPGRDGVAAYQGLYDQNNIIQFTLIDEYLKFPLNGNPLNLYVSKIDFPAIDDIDGDGDMDIISFGVIGGYVHYYENQSVQLGYGSDSLIFEWVDECWGRFLEKGTVNALELSPRMDSCIDFPNFHGQKGPHAGSTLLTWDMDNDNDKELFLGDVSFSTILYAKENAGNKDTAWFVAQETGFPFYDVPADIHIFPAMFSLDVNNDGLLDFVASPNELSISDDIEVAWYYKNTNNNQYPIFELVKKDLVAAGMIDMGGQTNPTFFDHNGDGLLDIVVGAYGWRNKSTSFHDSSIFLYENIGTLLNPKYRLIDTDYGGVLALNENGHHPTFGDFDGDGDEDMVVGDDILGQLKYLENMDNGSGIASFSTVVLNWEGIDVGDRSTPFAIDLNEDGLMDLVIGEVNGNVNYYENQGTAQIPNLVAVNSFLGKMDARSPSLGFPTGYSGVAFEAQGNDLYCYLGTWQGVIRKYLVDRDSLHAGSWLMVDGDFGKIREGLRTKIAIADINADGASDYLIGNKRGGLSLYSTQDISSPPTKIEELLLPSVKFSIWPNPTNDILNIGIEHNENNEMNLSIVNVLGQQLMSANIIGSKQLNVSRLAAGVYFVELTFGDKMIGVQKFVIN